MDPLASYLNSLLRNRQMCRAFTTEPVDPRVLRAMLDAALGAPAAGNSRGLHLVVLRGTDTARYWDVTLPEPGRSRFRWQGLLNAPVMVVPYVSPDAYLERYSEHDKRDTGLGDDAGSWPVPYWFVDGGAAVMAMLLVAEEAGLGALFFGQFDHAEALRQMLGVPPEFHALGTVAVGHRDATTQPGASSGRGRPSASDHVHLGAW